MRSIQSIQRQIEQFGRQLSDVATHWLLDVGGGASSRGGGAMI